MQQQDVGGVVFDTQVEYLVHDFGLLQGRRVIRISFHSIGAGSTIRMAASFAPYIIYLIFSIRAMIMILLIFQFFVYLPRMRLNRS